ncbi:MAG: hypothetical protein K8S21_13660 [Gemmatimonadetes bacterium]|nr:hypothetical protein [Gemmatimonadota bacterium]
MIRRLLRAPVLLAFPVALLVGACTERLDTASSCPVLCPGQTLDILDTILDPAVVLDTTLQTFPLLGFESGLLVATRGDTLDTRAIIRFDTLARVFSPPSDTARPVSYIDSATLSVRLAKTGIKVPQTFYLDAFDVGDTTLVDSLPTTLLPFFTAGRLLGSLRIDSASYIDSGTVRIVLDSAKLRQIVSTPGAVLRIGLQLRSTESGAFLVTSSDDATNGPLLRYRVSADTLVAAVTARPLSLFPRLPLNVNGDLVDYLLVADAPDIRKAGRFSVGGFPGRRTYLRFNLPRWMTDSTAVLRAQLEFVQDPVRGLDERDSLTIRAQVVLAGNATTDLNRAARLLAPAGFFVGDLLRVAPGDSGVVKLEINSLVRLWRTNSGAQNIPSALILRSELEGSSAFGANFFGLSAAPGLRPRLRVSYVPNIRFGQP